MDKLNLDFINTNKYFIGLMMIMLTIGGRFIIGEFSEKQKEKIDNSYFRKIFVFCAFFMATRDVLKALFLTIIFCLLMFYITKEDSKVKEEGENEDEKDFISNNGFMYL